MRRLTTLALDASTALSQSRSGVTWGSTMTVKIASEIVEPLGAVAARVLCLARDAEGGFCMVGESGVGVVASLVARDLVHCVPAGHGRYRVTLTDEGRAIAVNLVTTRGDQAERHVHQLRAKPRHRPEPQRWDRCRA